MRKEEIISVVEQVTGVQQCDMTDRKPVQHLFARYVAMLIMREEGFNNADIADEFGYHKSNITPAFMTIDGLLATNKPFKKMYLAAIARIAEIEDADELREAI